MMKRKLLAVVLPLIGCTTVVGSGFAAWYFGDSVSGGDDARFGAAVNITTEVDSESTTLTGSYSDTGMPTVLILDQGPAKPDGSVNDLATQGIAFASGAKNVIDSKETVNDFVFTVNYNGGGKTLEDLYNEGHYKVRVEVKIDLTALKGYVDLVSGAKVAITKSTSEELGPSVGTFTEVQDNIYTATYNAPIDDTSKTAHQWTFTLGLSTDNYANKLLKYAGTMKPTTSGEYDAMVLAIGGSAEININATAYLEIDPAVGA